METKKIIGLSLLGLGTAALIGVGIYASQQAKKKNEEKKQKLAAQLSAQPVQQVITTYEPQPTPQPTPPPLPTTPSPAPKPNNTPKPSPPAPKSNKYPITSTPVRLDENFHLHYNKSTACNEVLIAQMSLNYFFNAGILEDGIMGKQTITAIQKYLGISAVAPAPFSLRRFINELAGEQSDWVKKTFNLYSVGFFGLDFLGL